nr:putative glucose-6-phosphate 1-epimerase isoform X2 [Tanacetum cinerariifolium]
VLLYGGKVVSWKDSQGEELLFMSRKVGGRSPKGGISLCFPQDGSYLAISHP